MHPVFMLAGIFSALSDWFTGRTDGHAGYMDLLNCMNGDSFWIVFTVVFDLAVAAGCALIAWRWWRNQKSLRPGSRPRKALAGLRTIFLFGGLCAYVFIPLGMLWPGWRLYDLFLAALVFCTWRYAWSATSLNVIYSELNKTAQLARDLKTARAESQRHADFLNAVSHDLRTPLNGIVLQTHIAETALRSSDAAAVERSMRDIKASVRIAADVLDGLLQYARMEDNTTALDVMNLPELLDAICATFRAAAETKGLTLECHCRGVTLIYADRAKLERIVMNLIDNALKFTRRGSVTVTAGVRGQTLTLQIRDTGEGIAPEHQSRLFQEFFQVHNPQRDCTQGLGLGLAIAQRLSEQLGGEIAVESSPGSGSAFTLTLHGVGVPDGYRPAQSADGRARPGSDGRTASPASELKLQPPSTGQTQA